ncbi:MAG: IS200/IS605 family transposase [Bacteroidota bacterium]
MANTYTQIHIHAIFAVQNRQSLLQKSWRDELYSYITGILQNHGHKMLQINGVEDHVHMLFGLRPNQSLSNLMKNVKQHFSVWINEKELALAHFKWQAGYGAFSHSKSQLPKVIAYIQNQEEHHCKRSFQEEYLDFLDKWEIDFDQRYIFKPVL